MNNDTYEGWANRETWAVALHINNDQGWQESVHEDILEERAARLTVPVTDWEAGDLVRENVESALLDHDADEDGGVCTEGQWLALRDIGSLWRVDWTELGAAFLADLDE